MRRNPGQRAGPGGPAAAGPAGCGGVVAAAVPKQVERRRRRPAEPPPAAEFVGAGDHFPHEPIFMGLFGVHPKVAIAVSGDLLHVLPGFLRDQTIQSFANLQDLLSLDPNISGLATRTAGRLVQEEPRMGKRETLLAGRPKKDRNGDARDPAGPNRHHGRLDEAKHVVDRKSRIDVPPLRGDHHANRLVTLRIENQQLTHDLLGELVVHAA